ncbi:unnamed protein product, partial [Closterium sp. NIES-53]
MYLMTCTRPDLAYPLSLLARYVAPGRHRKVHWDAAKRVLRYLCSTSGMGLVLGGRARVVLTGHADASWVDVLATQRSSQGYTFSLDCWRRIGSAHFLAVETSVVAVGAARGTPRTPFFDGCSPSPLNPFYASAAAVDILGTEDVGAASALSGKRRSGKGKGGKSGRCGRGCGGGGGVEVVAAVGVVAGVGALVAAVVAAVGVGVAVVAAVGVVAVAVVAIGVELFRGEVLAVARGSSSNSIGARPLRPSSFASGLLSVGRLRVVFLAHMSSAQ